MSDPPSALASALAQDDAVASLLRALSFSKRFAFFPVLLRVPLIARTLVQRLVDHARARRVDASLDAAPEDCALETTEALLRAGVSDATPRVLDLGALTPRHRSSLLAVAGRLNERRAELSRGGPLIVALPVWAESDVALRAPDLWSVRSGIYLPSVDLRLSVYDEALLAALFASSVSPLDYSTTVAPETVVERELARLSELGAREVALAWSRIGQIRGEQGRWREALEAWNRALGSAEGWLKTSLLHKLAVGYVELDDVAGLRRVVATAAELERASSERSATGPAREGAGIIIPTRLEARTTEVIRTVGALLSGGLGDIAPWPGPLEGSASGGRNIPEVLGGLFPAAMAARAAGQHDASAQTERMAEMARSSRRYFAGSERFEWGPNEGEDDVARVGWAVAGALLGAEVLLTHEAPCESVAVCEALGVLRTTDIDHTRLDVERACAVLHASVALDGRDDAALRAAVESGRALAARDLERRIQDHPDHPWWPTLHGWLVNGVPSTLREPRVSVLEETAIRSTVS